MTDSTELFYWCDSLPQETPLTFDVGEMAIIARLPDGRKQAFYLESDVDYTITNALAESKKIRDSADSLHEELDKAESLARQCEAQAHRLVALRHSMLRGNVELRKSLFEGDHESKERTKETGETEEETAS